MVEATVRARLQLERENRRLRREVERLRPLRDLVYRDATTGLRNRRYFDERLSEEMARVARSPRCVGSLLVIDLNDFKAINDREGHLAGDETLRWVGELLEQTLRLHDVCCRTGGDEFMVLLPDTDAAGAGLAIDRLRSALEAANRQRTTPVSLAIGSASWPGDARDAAALVAAADAEMYADKMFQKAGGSAPAPRPPVFRAAA